MKAFIPTRGTDRLRSYRLAENLGLDWTLVVDNDAQRRAINVKHGIPLNRIVPTHHEVGPPTGAAFKRNFVAQNLADVGEWMVWLDDNVEMLTGIDYHLSTEKLNMDDEPEFWRAAFAKELCPRQVWYYVEETIAKAESLGTINCGFATEENYYFRKNKWQLFGYCRSQFSLFKNDGSSWMPIKEMMFEDMYKTVDVVARYGCVVVNRHMKAQKPHFEKGGIGTLEFRKPHLTHNCEWMMKQFPGLVKLSKDKDYHLTFQLRSLNTVNKWRKQHGYV